MRCLPPVPRASLHVDVQSKATLLAGAHRDASEALERFEHQMAQQRLASEQLEAALAKANDQAADAAPQIDARRRSPGDEEIRRCDAAAAAVAQRRRAELMARAAAARAPGLWAPRRRRGGSPVTGPGRGRRRGTTQEGSGVGL